MRPLRTNTLIILSLGVLVLALWLRRNRHVVLRVPEIGFILHAVLGGSVPPYMNDEAWQRQREWVRPGDVIVTLPAKSGTTWMLNTVHQIRTRGKGPDFDDILVEVPWADFVHYPGQPIEERLEFLAKTQEKYPIRAYKSHFAPPQIEFRKDVKYIVGVRDPREAAASFRDFFKEHTKEFAKTWGGFPPRNQTKAEFEHAFLVDSGDGKHPLADLALGNFLIGWWPYIKEPNVLMAHYKDRMKDPSADLDRIAKFLGVELTREERALVLEKNSFKWMKENNRKFSGCELAYYSRRRLGKMSKDDSQPCFLEPEALVAKGTARAEDVAANKAVSDRVEAHFEKLWGRKILDWAINGGTPPYDEKMPVKKV